MCQALWSGEVGDGPDVPLAWTYGVIGNFEACKFNLVLSKAKLLRVEGDPMFTTDVQPVCGLEEALFNRIGP